MDRKPAFTLIELLIVVAMLGLLVAIAVGGVGMLAGGAGYLEERAATIEPIRLYTVPSDSGTSYRCYAKVLRGADDESLEAETTFEITDTILKGQHRSADLYGKLREGMAFEITYYGVRIGYLSQFPKIISVNSLGVGQRHLDPNGLDDLYDD